MRPGRQQFHHDWNQYWQKLKDKLGIQTCAFPYLSDQRIKPVLAKEVFNLLKAGSGLRQIRNGLLDRPCSAGLLLLIQSVLQVRSQHAQDRLHLLLCSLNARDQLSKVQETVQLNPRKRLIISY